MSILYKSFHVIDIDNETAKRKEISEDFNDFVNEFIEFSNQNEKSKEYTSTEENLVSGAIQNIVLNPNDADFYADKIAKHLVETEILAQAKIYQMGLQVKRGSLVQTLIQKSEDEYQYIIAKVEHSQWYDDNLNKKAGFSSERKTIWKFAIYEMYSINNHIIINDIKAYSDTKAKYWTVSFLNVEEKRNDATNTYSAYKAIDNELKSAIKEVAPHDYVVLSNEVQNTLNEPQSFNYPEYIDSLMDSYVPSCEDIDKEVIKDCLMVLPERKKFDTEFKTIPQSIENKRTKKYKISDGIELSIKSNSSDFSKRIISTMKEGKRVLEIICDDEDTYAAFIEENE